MRHSGEANETDVCHIQSSGRMVEAKGLAWTEVVGTGVGIVCSWRSPELGAVLVVCRELLLSMFVYWADNTFSVDLGDARCMEKEMGRSREGDSQIGVAYAYSRHCDRFNQ